jgi:phosphoribosylanthranilate isomerase
MFRVKICGITTADDALLAAEAGADAIGLNFYEKSPRCVSPDRAAEILEALREKYSAQQVQVLAVFVNASLDDILWTIREANLYGLEQGVGLQLHGDEPPQLLADLRREGLGQTDNLFQVIGHVPIVPVVRAFRCTGGDLSVAGEYLQRCVTLGALPQAVLLDAYSASGYGGSGRTLDWDGIAAGRQLLGELPIILAGGLTPANVAAAITTARPDAVDVASGVESAPGVKDAAKVMAFVDAARRAFRVGSSPPAS